jgi:hypothetical protein
MEKSQNDVFTQEVIMQIFKIINQTDIKPIPDSQKLNSPVPQAAKIITGCEFESCRKKLRMVDRDFSCRCGKFFCKLHKFFESHGCTFDYKSDYAKKLKIDNPKIEHRKMDKI